VLALSYPIDRGRHAAIRHAIAERRAGRSVRDPLDSKRWIGAT
jgi:hypothetical protein